LTIINEYSSLIKLDFRSLQIKGSKYIFVRATNILEPPPRHTT
jgi:hypothetical protein